jgi:hypothetical protein
MTGFVWKERDGLGPSWYRVSGVGKHTWSDRRAKSMDWVASLAGLPSLLDGHVYPVLRWVQINHKLLAQTPFRQWTPKKLVMS